MYGGPPQFVIRLFVSSFPSILSALPSRLIFFNFFSVWSGSVLFTIHSPLFLCVNVNFVRLRCLSVSQSAQSERK